MSSRSGSPIATLLMFVPLVAVPLLAVFGVPKFPSLNASPTEDVDDHFDEPDWGPGFDQHDSADVFASADSDSSFPAGGPPPFETGGQSAPARGFSNDPFASESDPEWDLPPDALNGWSLESQAAPGASAGGAPQDATSSADSFPSNPDGSDAGATSAGDPFTWQSAVQRLRDFGIEDYHLQPGHQPELFHFSCLLEPSDNPSVIHRFEAESSQPLEAVRDVVTQIESWVELR